MNSQKNVGWYVANGLVPEHKKTGKLSASDFPVVAVGGEQ